MLVPERTVDSLFAYEALTALPQATLWSPTNTAGSYDHEVVSPSGLQLIIEAKAVKQTAAHSFWRNPIDQAQLKRYVAQPFPVTYLLPAQPDRGPWYRSCLPSCGASSHCVACEELWDPHARRWAGVLPRVRQLPLHRQFTYWFSHWAWCITATDLAAQISSKTSIKAWDADHAARVGAVRLCHLLEAARQFAPALPRPSHGPGTVAPGGSGGSSASDGDDGGSFEADTAGEETVLDASSLLERFRVSGDLQQEALTEALAGEDRDRLDSYGSPPIVLTV